MEIMFDDGVSVVTILTYDDQVLTFNVYDDGGGYIEWTLVRPRLVP